jgi:site-specific DNA recombinase
LIYNLKRLGRKLSLTIDAHDTLAHCGVTIHSITESIDTSTPNGKMVFQILGSFADYDADERAELLSRGRNRIARDGQYTGGPIPIGYDVDKHNRFILSERIVPELGIT